MKSVRLSYIIKRKMTGIGDSPLGKSFVNFKGCYFVRCEYCGSEVQGNFCGNCGAPVPQESRIENDSYKSNPYSNSWDTDYNKFSNDSGSTYYNNYSHTTTYSVASNKSKIVALVLCFLFGIFGIHRFYVGKVGTGLIWLFTGAIGGLGWIVDLILILTGNFKDSAGLPLK